MTCQAKFHHSQLRAADFRPRRERAHRMLPDFALPNSVPAESEQRVLVRAAEGDTDDTAAVGYGENDLRRTIVGADLHAATRGDELAAFNGVADTFRAGIVVPGSVLTIDSAEK
jgi:hypothetical protein